MLELIKKIRNQTGAGVIDIKKALDEAKGDEKKAIELLRKRGLEKADKKGDRDASEGIIASYVHSNGKVAVLVKLLCETDFVARNEEFLALGEDIAMHIAAMNPKCILPDQMSVDVVEEHKKMWAEELEKEGKPAEIVEKIMLGKEQKLRGENALLSQAFVKDPERTVEEIVKEKAGKMGENIKIGEFTRMQL
jgi:elongation factor Ts